MSTSQPQRDPLSPLAREVLALFREALAEVRFPDLDLARLEAGANELRTAQLEVERLEAMLATARAALAAESEALTARAQRGLSYARVFAEADAELALRVAAVSQPVPSLPARAPETKKRGRPRKGDGDASLFGDQEASCGAPLESVTEAAESAA